MPTVTLPQTNIKVTVEQDRRLVRVRMIENSEGKNKVSLLAGETYDLPQDSADFQVRLGRATYAETAVPVAEPELDDPESMTVANLTGELNADGVTFPAGSLKADLIGLVKQNRKAA